MYNNLIIRAKLVMPRPRRYLLLRPALSARLLESQHYRLTVVQAGTGYGKSTALVSALQEVPLNVFWYSLTEADRDARLFLLHLIYAFRVLTPEFGQKALGELSVRPTLQEAAGDSLSYQAVIDALSNELMDNGIGEGILVLDDYHLVNAAPEINAIVDHFLDVLPPNLHLIIATRHRPALKGRTVRRTLCEDSALIRWRVKGDLLEITQRDLAFSADEIEALFRTQYGLALTGQQVQRLTTETEGWVIALQMIWQSLQSGVAGSLDQILEELPRSLEDLFTYLAQEVLARRPPHIQDFLLRTSVLRQLEPGACDYLLGWDGSETLLEELDDEEFFVVRQGDAYRYHHLFHDFLRQQARNQVFSSDAASAKPGFWVSLHRQAAGFYERKGEIEETIYHLLAAEEYEAAAERMAHVSESMVRGGRFDTMNEWVIALPPFVLEQFPALMYQMGELCRFACRFDEALAWYGQAEDRYLHQRDVAGASRALRGQAAVYLDTVRPIKAESLLQEALSLVDGQPDRQERARLLDLLAENMTNRGRWEEAASLRQQARELREEGPVPADLDVRVLLRTGRLAEARAILEERAAEERRRPDSYREPRGHRETLLVLSLIYAFQGLSEEALDCAQEGIEVGRQLGSPFIEAVGYMRLGHAWQISEQPNAGQQALACYRRAIEIGERLAVPRVKVEALWGLCRLYGFQGDLTASEQCAREGREVGLGAGDEWVTAQVDMMLGASYAIAGRDDARDWLEQAAGAFHDCGDPFGQMTARLWQCLFYQQQASADLSVAVGELLASVGALGYEFLFDRLTFLGPPDPAALVPLLVVARQGEMPSSYADAASAGDLLTRMGLPPDLEFHPGYTLRVHTLGGFTVYRGQEKVGAGEWRREKARQLFQLFLANYGRFLERDEITALLWPETDSPTALAQQFKVTLNALQQALEPKRPPRTQALFVQRRGSAYRLNPAAPLWLDAAAFEHLINQGLKVEDEMSALELYQQALGLYEGDFLPTCLYEDWCRDERERLRRLYLTTATKVAEVLLEHGEVDEAIGLCHRVLAVDNCWEVAYQYLIQAYIQKRDQVQAFRTYERCLTCLKEELDVVPMPETTALYEQARRMLS